MSKTGPGRRLYASVSPGTPSVRRGSHPPGTRTPHAGRAARAPGPLALESDVLESRVAPAPPQSCRHRRAAGALAFLAQSAEHLASTQGARVRSPREAPGVRRDRRVNDPDTRTSVEAPPGAQPPDPAHRKSTPEGEPAAHARQGPPERQPTPAGPHTTGTAHPARPCQGAVLAGRRAPTGGRHGLAHQ